MIHAGTANNYQEDFGGRTPKYLPYMFLPNPRMPAKYIQTAMDPHDIRFPPYQGSCVKVSVINGAKSHMLARMLVHPAPESKRYLNLAGYSFPDRVAESWSESTLRSGLHERLRSPDAAGVESISRRRWEGRGDGYRWIPGYPWYDRSARHRTCSNWFGHLVARAHRPRWWSIRLPA